MPEHLHVFALNVPVELRHTHLTRMQGVQPDLPPLADWTGMAIDPGQIELFPIRDLAGVSLSTYISTAFDVDDPDLNEQARRMDAVSGAVLLVPSRAKSVPKPGAQATLIATLKLAQADHSPQPLPKADATGALATGGTATTSATPKLPGWLIALALGFVLLIGLIVLL